MVKKKSSLSRKKVARRKKSPAAKKSALKKRALPKKKMAAARKPSGKTTATRRARGSADFTVAEPSARRGLGQDAGGQSGDTEGLTRTASAASESVEELVEEGQAFEAGIISGVENAPDADEAEVTTREVPEDDVPEEYLDQD